MPLSHVRAYAHWEQLALFPLDELTLEFTIHLVPREDLLQVGLVILEGSNGQTVSMHVSGTRLNTGSLVAAAQLIDTVLQEAAERLGPPR